MHSPAQSGGDKSALQTYSRGSRNNGVFGNLAFTVQQGTVQEPVRFGRIEAARPEAFMFIAWGPSGGLFVG